jgi:hypothetical protein
MILKFLWIFDKIVKIRIFVRDPDPRIPILELRIRIQEANQLHTVPTDPDHCIEVRIYWLLEKNDQEACKNHRDPDLTGSLDSENA